MNTTWTRLALGAALLGAVAVSLPHASLAKNAAKSGEFRSISQKELLRAIKAKQVTIFDANGDDSYKEGRIPTAINFYAVESKFASYLPKNKSALVVAYCGNEHCTAYKQAALAAQKLGYTNVAHFAPGIAGWRASGAAQDKG